MSLIEQAAQRLEQLRKAGVDIPSSPEVVMQSEQVHVSPPRTEATPPQTKVADRAVIQTPEMVMSRRVELNLDV